MKEKYIFFTLLAVALVMLIGAKIGKRTEPSYAKQLAIEKKLKQATRASFTKPEKLDIDKIQDLVAFSEYEPMLKRSPFFKVQIAKPKTKDKPKNVIVPVEEKTPTFVYKGRIGTGNRTVVIIGQTRSGEVFMVSEGENVDGYKVLKITDADVTLSKENEDNIVLKTVEMP